MASKNWVKISWSNVFLPDGTKPLSELFFAIIWTDFDIPVVFTWGSYFRWIVQMPIIKMCLNFAQTRLLPGTNEIRETSYRTEKWNENKEYCQTFDISHTLGNIIVDYSDVVGASPVGTAPTTSSVST